MALLLPGRQRKRSIRIPSLYNHIAGLDGLRRDLMVLGGREMTAQLARATIGKAGDDALLALAQAYRAYAKEHPGLYAAVQRAPDFRDPEAQAVGGAVVEVAVAVMASYGLQGDDAVHAVRGLRSALHGFVTLETAGGFGLPIDLDESYRRLIQMLMYWLRQGQGSHEESSY